MFVLPVYLHAQEIHYQQIIFSISQKDKSSAVLVIFAAIMCILTCLFVTLSSLICSCHREYLSIGSVRVLVRASELAHAYMQIIAVDVTIIGVTNKKRDL